MVKSGGKKTTKVKDAFVTKGSGFDASMYQNVEFKFPNPKIHKRLLKDHLRKTVMLRDSDEDKYDREELSKLSP